MIKLTCEDCGSKDDSVQGTSKSGFSLFLCNKCRAEKKFLMNPKTGIVRPLQTWIEDYECMSEEIWGGKNFEDAKLIEVTKNENGKWVEA